MELDVCTITKSGARDGAEIQKQYDKFQTLGGHLYYAILVTLEWVPTASLCCIETLK